MNEDFLLSLFFFNAPKLARNFAFPCLLSSINYPKHSEKLLIKFSIFPFPQTPLQKNKKISNHPSPNPPAIPTIANSFFAKSRLNPIHDLRVERIEAPRTQTPPPLEGGKEVSGDPLELQLEASSGTGSVKAARGRAQPEAAPASVDTGKPSTSRCVETKVRLTR